MRFIGSKPHTIGGTDVSPGFAVGLLAGGWQAGGDLKVMMPFQFERKNCARKARYLF
jgi:hypothetical protein